MDVRMLNHSTWEEANERRLREFLWWCYERQEIFRKRFILEEEPPWTDVTELREYHFCHVYRELDRGTRFLINNIISRKNNRDVLFNTIFYRLVNLPESYKAAGGFTPVDEFEVEPVISHLQAYREMNPVFSPAYRVSAHKFADSDSKVENIIKGVLGKVQTDIDTHFERISRCDDLGEMHDALKEIVGVGDFLAYEIATDLSYQYNEIHENDFVNIGPGAEAGMERIWDDAEKSYIYWIVENQEELLDHFDLDLYKWTGCEWKDLTLRDVEHSYCEYNKFRRAKTQDNPNLRLFEAMSGEQLNMEDFK